MPALDFSGYDEAVKVKAPPHGAASLAPIGNVMEGGGVGAQAVQQAATQLGKPYVFGSGPSTQSFDCSDLVQWSYKQLGVSIPRDTWGQQKALPLKAWKDLRPGDPIYRKSGGHVVIYAGGGKVIAAPHTGTVVQYQPLTNFPPSGWEVRSISR
jgi:cell wall-associated NlpC family hydrolase